MWKTSTKCDTGSCTQIAMVGDKVLVRNSTRPDGPVLTFTSREWQTELDAIRTDGLPNGLSLLLPDGDMLWQHDGATVRFTRDEVAAFIDAALDGEFDHAG